MSEPIDDSVTPASSGEATVTAALLVIGDEILSGRTKDKNIGYIADHLTAIGIQLREVRIVSDDEAAIVEAVNALRARNSYVLTTGGIGPTHDDITADSVAKAFGVAIDVDERAVRLMRPHYEARGLEFTESRMRMARIPEGAELIENRVSHAPGFMIGNVIVLAGIPSIMQIMLDAVTPRLEKGRRMLSQTIDVHRPESEIARALSDVQADFADVAMGSYPFVVDGKFGSQLVLRSVDEARLRDATAALERQLREEGLI